MLNTDDTNDPEPTYRVAISRAALTEKIPHGSPLWPKFNASFENRQLRPVDLAAAVYDGHAFTTWHKDGWRKNENYLAGQHLGLDFDSGDKSSTLAELVKDRFIAHYAAFAYTTMSHTEEAPRARVVFVIDQPIMQAKNYALAAAALLWVFGTADRQCKDPARFWYGSPRCNVEFLDNVLPLDVVKRLIERYRESGAQEKRRRTWIADTPADQNEVAEALRRIDPWAIDYDEWVSVLMGIHAEFGDQGLALAEGWAQGRDGEVAQKWRGFKSAGNGMGAVTIATVFKLAIDRGWQRAA